MATNHGGSAITTFLHDDLDLTCPDSDHVWLGDIAHSLSHLCRFTGMTSRFYSVAEHSCLVHDLVLAEAQETYRTGGKYREDLITAALFHDAAEAYLGDVSAPLKHLLAGVTDLYDSLTESVNMAVAETFSFDVADLERDEIGRADDRALIIEASRMMGGSWSWAKTHAWREIPEGVRWAGFLRPAAARDAFVARANALIPALAA